jgi:hypothetical protein
MTPIMDGIKLRIHTQEKDKTQHTKKKRYEKLLFSPSAVTAAARAAVMCMHLYTLILNATEAPSTYK